MKLTTELAAKLVPFTVSVNAAPPAVALVGERVVTVGTGLLMVKVALAEVPPPGAGLVTVTLTAPGVTTCAAVIAAVSCVALTNVVVDAVPLKLTTDVETKLVPFTVKVNEAAPAVTLGGESVVTVGTGLFTVNTEAAEVPPPGAGLVTVTLTGPAVAMSAAAMAAVS